MRPLLLALAIVSLAGVGVPAASARVHQDPDGFTPLVQTVVAPPWPVKGSDGRFHAVYEVQLLNASPCPGG